MDMPLWATLLVAVLGSGGGTTITAWILKRVDQHARPDPQLSSRLDAMSALLGPLSDGTRELLLCRLEDLREEMVNADGIADEDLKGRSQRLYDIYHSMGGNGHGTALNDDIQRAPIRKADK